MELAWGNQLGETIAGLDIAGVRGLDQRMEAALVNGITTVSPRGRYFTVLCWALCEFFEAEKTLASSYEPDRLGRFLARVEFLVLACTVLDPGTGSGAGALGLLNYADATDELAAGRTVRFPDGTRSAMMATYLGPCRALGLLGNEVPGSQVGFTVTPRGQLAWKERSAAMAGVDWAGALSCEILDAGAAVALVPYFSLKRLTDFSGETGVLRRALAEPWSASGAGANAVAEAYAAFQWTVDWLRKQSREHGPNMPNADLLLHGAWTRVARSGLGTGGIEDAWAECEWRRRLHYAVELILSAVADTVRGLGSATLGEVVDEWLHGSSGAEAVLTPRLATLWPAAAFATTLTSQEAFLGVPEDLFLDASPSNDLTSLPPGERALASFALVSCLARQSAPLRFGGIFRDFETIGEQALACVERADDERFRDALQRLASVTVASHLATTLRKMGGGQNCSLRFFPEGPKLLALQTPTKAGRSGSRLWNVVSVLRDVGELGIAGA